MKSGFGGMVGITEANPEEEGLWNMFFYILYLKKDYKVFKIC